MWIHCEGQTLLRKNLLIYGGSCVYFIALNFRIVFLIICLSHKIVASISNFIDRIEFSWI